MPQFAIISESIVTQSTHFISLSERLINQYFTVMTLHNGFNLKDEFKFCICFLTLCLWEKCFIKSLVNINCFSIDNGLWIALTLVLLCGICSWCYRVTFKYLELSWTFQIFRSWISISRSKWFLFLYVQNGSGMYCNIKVTSKVY